MVRTQDIAGNSFNSALNLGTFKNKTRSITDSVSKADPNDYFRFKIAASSVSVISLTRLSADADMEIYYQTRNNPVSFSNPGTNSEVAFDDNAPPGTYYVRVLPGSSREAQYTLTIHTIAIPRSNQTSLRSRATRQSKFNATGEEKSKLSASRTGSSLWT